MGRRAKPVSANTIGGRMRLAREAKNILLSDLAGNIGCTKGHLSAIETGLDKPSQRLIDDYERILEFPPGTISEGEKILVSRVYLLELQKNLAEALQVLNNLLG